KSYNLRITKRFKIRFVLLDAQLNQDEDPTKSIDDKCPNNFVYGLGIGSFLGMIALA
ncbi:16433_t:CDS:2, partial [Racocetra persica]